jgi:hypothetical protein
VSTGPTADGIRLTEDPIVGADIVRLPRGQKGCLGTPMTMTFAAVQDNLDAPGLPIFGAAIELTAEDGTSKREWTDSAGLATFTWPADKKGEINFSVRADKEGYDADGPEEFRLRVEPCRWDLSVDYREEYAIIDEAAMVVGAEVHWVGTVRPADPDAPQGAEALIVEGTGTWAAYAKDQIKAPIHTSLDPEASGSYDLEWDARIEFGALLLDLKSVKANFPAMTYIKLTDYTNHYQINYKPPTPWVLTDGDVLKSNGLSHTEYPDLGGGVFYEYAGPPNFFYTPNRTEYSLRFWLKESKVTAP